MKRNSFILIITILVCISSCTPKAEQEKNEFPPIFPNYCDITIPQNIAPLNFMIEDADKINASFCHGKMTLNYSGKRAIKIDEKDWHKMLNDAIDDSITINVSIERNDTIVHYKPFKISVSKDCIDKYLSYRLIEPGYEVWHKIQIAERDLSSFDERIIADNNLYQTSCMNCHTYSGNGRSYFHLRGKNGGTIINDNGHIRKIDTKPDGLYAAATYGNFDNEGRYGIFSTNTILPEIHTDTHKRMEVYDSQSDIVLIDLKDNTIEQITIGDEYQETFPTFNTNGDTIYYCIAKNKELPDSILELRYKIIKRAFDRNNGVVDTTEILVWSCDSLSASFPKISPDGKWLLFTTQKYGTFPLWHRESDLAMINISTGEAADISNVNSSYSDTYHSWSSNSRWIVFATKRDDGMYGRPYISHIDTDGKASKPFLVPQLDPIHYQNTLKSYNIPELSAYSAQFDAINIERIYNSAKAELLTLKQIEK